MNLILQKISPILIISFCLGQIVFPMMVSADSSLYVDISVNPASGPAPLNNVDLTASVSGTATGDITYRFDCTNDGSWEKTQTTSSTSYTATDLCSYSSVGNYTARISVEREGLVFYGTTAIFVGGGSDLYVTLSASPSSGSVPLNDVDLTASVSGSASGDILYKFDCTNDGSWEKTQTTSSTSYTATDLCDYSTSGNYTAKVYVERGGLSFQGTAAIAVGTGGTSTSTLAISKDARNISQNQLYWSDTIQVKPGETIAFKITVTSTGGTTADNVIVSDTLPQQLISLDNIKVNDQSVSVTNIAAGVNIGSLSSGQTKTVTFEARVADEGNFGFGTTTLVNTGLADANNVSSVFDTARIQVQKTKVAGATTVSTGAMDYLYYSLLIVFMFSLAIYALNYRFEHSQNRLVKVFLKKYYMLKLFAMPPKR